MRNFNALVAGFRPLAEDQKTGIAFSYSPLKRNFIVHDAKSGKPVYQEKAIRSKMPGRGTFPYYYQLDFSELQKEGRYSLSVQSTGDRSAEFGIGREAYGSYHEDLPGLMRQQRCGYNPFPDMVCHQRDGCSMDGTADALFMVAYFGLDSEVAKEKEK